MAELPRQSRREIRAALNRLQEHGFIGRWEHSNRSWVVYAGAWFGPYSDVGICGFLDGARAMGAGI